MRLVSLLIVMTTFLISCSSYVDSNNENEAENIVTESSMSEEILLKELPTGVSREDWNLILVNPFQALPTNFDVELIEVDNEQIIDERVVDHWRNWKEAALKEGHRLFLASGFRSVSRQESNFDQTIKEYMDEGMEESGAVEKTKEYLAEPEHSEHHTGLALDIVDEEWIVSGQGLELEYANKESQKWLISSMSDYGFILRYPEGKKEVTGINYEPWHFRYVGVENAQFIEANNLTLEEYIELLKKAGE